MDDKILREKLFEILTKTNISRTFYGVRYDNRPYEEIIEDIVDLIKKENILNV
jgi:hypothetical protein